MRKTLRNALFWGMNLIKTERLGHRFGKRILFRKMDIELEGGHTTAIVGSNGSGKSTLVRILAGLLQPYRGSVQLIINGTEIEQDVRPLSCGLVAPYLSVYEDFTPRENLEFIARARRIADRDDRIEAALDQVQILSRADDVVHTFSSGMLQRVRIATALLSDPPLLLLDEPTSTLDPTGVAMVRRVIDQAVQNGRIVVVATNESDEARACEHVINVEDYR